MYKSKNRIAFVFKSSVVRLLFFITGLTFDQHMIFFQNILKDFHYHGIKL